MTQPAPYERIASFSNLQAQAPDDPPPGATLDAEFNAVKTTLDAILANMELIQRDDGALANESVGTDQLSEELSAGINTWTVWVTATGYAVNDTVFANTSKVYRCLEAHTSGTFATDLAAAKWELIVDLAALTLVAASQIANTPAGSIAATTVQAAIDELASEKAALSHTHAASALSDSTAAGRAMLTAASAAAQGVLLGLGDLAFEDTVVLSEIEENLAFAGIIEPAALNSTTHNWAPTGIATASTIRVSASTDISLTGILAPAVDGTVLLLENVGTKSITLPREHASSSAANRFLFSRDFVLRPDQGIALKYDLDGTTPRWRSLAPFGEKPRGYIVGLAVSNNGTDATNDIDIAAGEARDSTDAFTLVGTAMTKRLDANWSAGTGNGMRNSAAAITDTTYHIYLVGTRDGTTDYYAHTSTTVATVLTALQAEAGGADYVFARRIRSIVRTGAAIQLEFQRGDKITLKTAVVIVDSADHSSATLGAASIPVGLELEVEIHLECTSASGGQSVTVRSPLGTSGGATAYVPSAGSTGANCTRVFTNTAGQFTYQASNSAVDSAFRVLAYVDTRGRFD